MGIYGDVEMPAWIYNTNKKKPKKTQSKKKPTYRPKKK
tara:strand:+ start:3881 stop:3994 length:114 start_codon:yes stop_codon:yes gene_type:complete